MKNDIKKIIEKSLPELPLLLKYSALVSPQEFDRIKEKTDKLKTIYESLKSVLLEDEIKELYNSIDKSNSLTNLEKLELIALTMAIVAGKYPTLEEDLTLIERHFGKEMAAILKNKALKHSRY